MKKSKEFIGIFLLAGFLLTVPSYGQQTSTPTKKEKHHSERLTKKKEHAVQNNASRTYYLQLLKHKHFVFQADYLTGAGGQTVYLTPNVNFMSVNGKRIILQLGFNQKVSWNGVGGMTVHGTVYNYRIDQGKKKNNIFLYTNITRNDGQSLSPAISLNVSDNGTAQLIVQPPKGFPVVLYGKIVSPDKTNIFVGHSLF
ncbi:DUF4251 domain-containing protein [Candidatus Sulfidibacterium hydrothermale]|uniref:DUF4251 domain-containing protein n=1 Tax=Candidatus Sulfidibacterium hydrothermale TaxID=2875962 RepID=UPI001F0B68C9|nr:DUF4251 domain-containing protein [Candidatus Sulfidibacterium hydrothermale]UBM63449.1 DUF4251 domain-containing protein [Candidatus Sulfidibacterium hydrothermale]